MARPVQGRQVMSETNNTIEDLKKLRDEVKVKMHLGEMDVKEKMSGEEK